MSVHYWVAQLTVALPTALLVTVLIVTGRYFVIWTKVNRHDWRGLLPLHVAAIGLSYLVVMGLASNEVRNLFENDYGTTKFWVKFALITFAEVLGIVAMGLIFGFGKRSSGSARWKRRREKK